MSLNPLLYSSKQPLQVPGEGFLLAREGMACEVRVEGLPTLKATGQIFLTTLRIVFVCSKKQPLGGGAAFESFEFPITTLSDEKFNQPIFGANYLSGTVQPVAGSELPGEAHFKLTFREGGCQTFLYFFLRALRDVRNARRPGESTLASLVASGRLQTASAAFVDPNDPSTIYVTQPDVPLARNVSYSAYGENASRVVVAVPVDDDHGDERVREEASKGRRDVL